MSNPQRILLIVIVIALLTAGVLAVLYFTGVLNPDNPSSAPDPVSPGNGSPVESSSAGEPSSEDPGEEEIWSEEWTMKGEYDPAVFSDYDRDTDFSAPDATIVCDGTDAKITGKGASADKGTISITAEGTYVLQGNYKGRLLIALRDTEKAHLVFNGFTITCASYSPVLCTAADKVCLTLADGTVNEVQDTGTGYVKGADEQEEIEGRSAGAMHFKCDLSINGNGKLKVTGNYRHGIFSKNDLRILSGRIEVDASGSGIKGKNSITVGGGSFHVRSDGDAFKVTETAKAGKGFFQMTDGVITAETKADGIDASMSITIEGGRIKMTTVDNVIVTDGSVTLGTRKSAPVLRLASTGDGKGVRAFGDVLIDNGDILVAQSSESIISTGNTITVRGGQLRLFALDEGLEAKGNLILSGGSIWIDGEGGGISADKKLSVSGGTIVIDGPTGGDGGIVELNLGNGLTGTWAQSDGLLIGMGNPAEENSPTSKSEGRVIHIRGTFRAGNVYALREQEGETVAVFSPAKDSSVLLIALPPAAEGKTYELIGDVQAEGKPVYGLYDADNGLDGNVILSVTVSGVYTEAELSG